MNQSTVVINQSYIYNSCTVENSSSNVMNTTYNYWDDPTGPKPSGKGATVSGNVNYIPFLTSPGRKGPWIFSFPIIYKDSTYTIFIYGDSLIYNTLKSQFAKPIQAQAEYIFGIYWLRIGLLMHQTTAVLLMMTQFSMGRPPSHLRLS